MEYVGSEFLQKVIEKIPGNIWWKDKNLVYRGCNERTLEVLGLSSHHEVIGKTDHELWDKAIADQLKAADIRVLESGSTTNHEETLIAHDGKPLLISTNRSPLYDTQNNIMGIVGASMCVAEPKQNVEERLQQAKELTDSAGQLKAEFIHNMEHDIRTPFNGIWMLASMLESQETDPEKKEALADISMCAKELLDYCNSILDFAKVEAGVAPILAKKFDLQVLVNKIVIMETPPAKNKGVVLKTEFAEDVPKVVIGDQHRVERVLINLASNAVKFTQEGFVKIAVKVVKRESDKRVIIRLIVEDSGIGIAKEKQAYIYEKFTRVMPSNRGIYKGSGLGLRVVKQLVEELEGEIDVKSELGKGSTFTCTLPLKLPLVDEVLTVDE